MRIIAYGAVYLCCAWIIGCAASEPETASHEPRSKVKQSAPLTVHERDFSPSQYDVAIAQVESSSQRYVIPDEDTLTTASNSREALLPGFRVQVMFSNSIDEATRMKNELTPLFPSDIVYTLYDSPYYKVRVGDYQERNHAAQTLKLLLEKGYTQSWIVPDRVRENPVHNPPTPTR
jgi:hypothetical protein